MNNLTLVEPVIHIKRGKVTTSSMSVSEYFGKSHSVILRSIRNLECSEEFGRCNFAPSSYLNKQGKTQPYYEITKDGFAMLAFGFTGKQAATFKEKYIAAFNAMLAGLPDDRNAAIKSKRLAHSVLMDCVKFNREQHGKDTDAKHYMVENKLCNWAIRGEFKTIDESTMPAWELKLLERVRMHDEALLIDGVSYEDRKAKLKTYADRFRLMMMPVVGKLSHGGVQ